MMMIELSIVQREKKIDIYKERKSSQALIRPEARGEIGTAPSPRLAGR